MKKVVLLRHGESTWNRENRFTGWTDVDLSEKGVAEAEKAGLLLREEGFLFGHAYTSYLKRAVKTLGVEYIQGQVNAEGGHSVPRCVVTKNGSGSEIVMKQLAYLEKKKAEIRKNLSCYDCKYRD